MDILSSSVLLQNVNDPVSFWLRPEIFIFLVTVISYLLGFLVYGGYLSAFAGSTGITPFAFSDLTVFDILAILPMAIIAIIKKIASGVRSFLIFVGVYFLLPLIIGMAVRIWKGQFVPSELSTVSFLVGMLFWTGALIFVALKRVRYFTGKFFLAFVISTIGMIVSFSGAGQPPSTVPSNTMVESLNVFFGFLYAIIGLLGAYVIGFVTAETVVEQHGLSKVLRVVLSQPVPSMWVAAQVRNSNEINPKKKWFSKSAVPALAEPKVYSFEPSKEKPLYLVSSFRNFTLFYIPDGEKGMGGRLVSVSNQVIYSLELHIHQRKKETT